MKEFAINIANAYEFGPTKVAMGLTMFSTTARQPIPLTTGKTSFINGVYGVIQEAGWTCIGCGIQMAQLDIANAVPRPDAQVVFIVQTDGKNNRPIGQTHLLPSIVQNAKNQGIIFFSIAVADADHAEVEDIASDIPGVKTYFQTANFAELANIVDDLTLATCIGNPYLNHG